MVLDLFKKNCAAKFHVVKKTKKQKTEQHELMIVNTDSSPKFMIIGNQHLSKHMHLCCLVLFQLDTARVIWEEGTSTGKMPPEDPAAGHFLN